eukprot:jgi/Chlat1/5433/Chrsp36S05437
MAAGGSCRLLAMGRSSACLLLLSFCLLLSWAAEPSAAAPSTLKCSGGLQLVAEHHAAGRGRQLADLPAIHRHGLGDLHVVINALAYEDAEALLVELEPLGFELSGRHGLLLSGILPKGAISALEDLEQLRHADRSYPAARAMGIAATAGDQAIYTDVLRQAYNTTGTGAKIAIISDAFNSQNGLAADMFTGDMPSGSNSVVVLRELSQVLQGRDEGRAMLQIVYDVAPGATLYFLSGFAGAASIVSGLPAIYAAGIDIIVDDLGFYEEPFFMDGVLAQAVDQAFATGLMWFSAAGNDADNSWEVSCPSGCSFTGPGNSFAFSRGVYRQEISICYFCTVTFVFQWDEPFASATNGVVGSSSDLDIALYSGTGVLLASSREDNIKSGNAFEVLTYTCSPDVEVPCLGYLEFILTRGSPPKRMKYLLVSSGVGVSGPTNRANYGAGTIYGHPNSLGAIAVGAADYKDTQAFGTCPPVKASFSSVGGVPILFSKNGTRLARPEIRLKPDVIGPSGADVSFFSIGVTADILKPCTLPNFIGTSAAAPHLGAAAALMLSVSPNLTAADIYGALRSEGIDMGPPGPDFQTGYGLSDAAQALRSANDNDSDGVPTSSDQCPKTPVGEVVDATGCSVTQLCPCFGPKGSSSPWLNTAAYICCVKSAIVDFVVAGVFNATDAKEYRAFAEELQCRSGRRRLLSESTMPRRRHLLAQETCGNAQPICPPIPDGYMVLYGILTINLTDPFQDLLPPVVNDQLTRALNSLILPRVPNAICRATANYAIRRSGAPLTAKYFIIVPKLTESPVVQQTIIEANATTDGQRSQLTSAVNAAGLSVVSVTSTLPVPRPSLAVPAITQPITPAIWSPLLNTLPVAEFAFSAAQCGSNLLIGGGNGNNAQQAFRLNLETGDAFAQPPAPSPVRSGTATAITTGGSCYFVQSGGLAAPSTVVQILKNDDNNPGWLADVPPMNIARRGHALYTVGSRICALGPYRLSRKVECLDFNNRAAGWQVLPRTSDTVIVDFDSMYVQIGTDLWCFPPDRTKRRDISMDVMPARGSKQPATKEYRYDAVMRFPRRKAAVAAVLTRAGPQVWVAGGILTSTGAISNVVELFHPYCDPQLGCYFWTTQKPLNTARSSFGLGVLNQSVIFALGGLTDTRVTNDEEAFLIE